MTIEITKNEADLLTVLLGRKAWELDTTNQSDKARDYRRIISKIHEAMKKWKMIFVVVENGTLNWVPFFISFF